MVCVSLASGASAFPSAVVAEPPAEFTRWPPAASESPVVRFVARCASVSFTLPAGPLCCEKCRAGLR